MALSGAVSKFVRLVHFRRSKLRMDSGFGFTGSIPIFFLWQAQSLFYGPLIG